MKTLVDNHEGMMMKKAIYNGRPVVIVSEPKRINGVDCVNIEWDDVFPDDLEMGETGLDNVSIRKLQTHE